MSAQTHHADELRLAQVRGIGVRRGWATGLIAACGVFDLITVAHGSVVLWIVEKSRSGQPVSEDFVALIDGVAGLAALVGALAYISAPVMFCCWFYRVYRNATLLSATKPPMSPGWAVGYFFIPVLCLFRPFQAAQHAWKECARIARPDHPPPATIVGVWWIAWIVSNIVGQIWLRLAMSGANAAQPTLDDIAATARADVGSSGTNAFAAALCVAFIVRLSRLQHAAVAQMGLTRQERSPSPAGLA